MAVVWKMPGNRQEPIHVEEQYGIDQYFYVFCIQRGAHNPTLGKARCEREEAPCNPVLNLLRWSNQAQANFVQYPCPGSFS
eukprot:1056923-Amphidinium_carterae.1